MIIDTDDYVTFPEAAALLKCSSSAVARYIKNGRLASVRVGRKCLLILKESIAAFVPPTRGGYRPGSGKPKVWRRGRR